MQRLFLAVAVVMVVLPAAQAGELQRGDLELGVEFSRSTIDFGSVEGMDLGEVTSTRVRSQLGWFLAAHHEIGLYVNYDQSKYSNSFLGSSTFDSSEYGLFYEFHFITSGSVLPYVGVAGGLIGGDIGDAYDLEYAVVGGFKLYPWEHAGFNVELDYGRLTANQDGAPDSTGVWVSAGILVKF